MKRERGFAILLVLWALIPLSILLLILTATARWNAQSTGDLRTAAALEAEADGAIYTAIFGLLSGETPPGPGGSPVRVETVPLSGLVNPNTASAELLQALMVRVGADPSEAGFVARAVVDWRTPGRRPGLNGSRSDAYARAGLAYGPPGAPFESLDELGLVFGMTPALLEALLPHVSLYAVGDPDPRAATAVVRGALADTGVVRGPGALRTEAVQITATATGPGDSRASRRAIIRVGPSANGRNWQVLAWDVWYDR